MHDEGDREENITLRMNEPEFRYLKTVMSMYVDSGKAYIQVATGALVLPIVFLRNLLGASTTVVDRMRAEAIRAFDSGISWRGIDDVFASGTNAAGAQCRATRAIAMR